jgi:hypothetical protein
MNIEKLIEKTNTYFNCDITKNTRIKNIAIVRRVFFVIAKDLGYTLTKIGKSVNRGHSIVWVAHNTHDDNILYDKHYRECYNDFYNHIYGVKIEEDKKEIKTQIKGFDALLDFSEEELLEFKETRLEPFIMMLKSRNNKQLNK